METYQFSILDYVIFILLLLGSLLIGIYHTKRHSSSDEYLMGNRNMGILPVSLSLIASNYSTIFLLGISSEVYLFGAIFFWNLVEGLLVAIATSYVFLPIFFSIQCISTFEYFELRFNKYVQYIGSIAFFLQTTMYLSFVIYAPSLIANQATGVDVWICASIIGIVCTLYTSLGGIKAVMWTDVFQCTYMLLSIIAVLIIGCIEIGGISYVWEKNVEHNKLNIFNFDLDPTTRYTVWAIVLGNGMNTLTKFAISQSYIQRYLCTNNLKFARQTVWLNYLGSAIFITCTTLVGMILFGAYWDCDPYESGQIKSRDQILPFFVLEKLGKKYLGLSGLFSAGLISCAISTMSSSLSSLTAIAYKQVIQLYSTHQCIEKHSMLIVKLLSFLFGILSIAFIPIIAKAGGIFSAMVSFISILMGPVSGIFFLGMLCPRATSLCAVVGAFCGMVTSFCMVYGQLIIKTKNDLSVMSTNGCNVAFNDQINISTILLNNTSLIINNVTDSDIFWLFKVSYLWNRFISILTTVIVGILFSYIFGLNNSENVDPNLISPVVQRIQAFFNKRKTVNSNLKNIVLRYEMETLKVNT